MLGKLGAYDACLASWAHLGTGHRTATHRPLSTVPATHMQPIRQCRVPHPCFGRRVLYNPNKNCYKVAVFSTLNSQHVVAFAFGWLLRGAFLPSSAPSPFSFSFFRPALVCRIFLPFHPRSNFRICCRCSCSSCPTTVPGGPHLLERIVIIKFR